MRLFALVLSLAFVTTACKKAPQPAPPAASPAVARNEAPPAAEPPPAVETPPAEEPAPEPQDADDAEYGDDEFEVFTTKLDASMVERFLTYRAAMNALPVTTGDQKSRDDMAPRIAAAQEKAGLSAREAEALYTVSNEIVSSTKAGATGKEVAPQARAKYGDDVVDALLAKADVLRKLEQDENEAAEADLRALAEKKRKILLSHATYATMDDYEGDDWAYFVDEVEQTYKKKHPAVLVGSSNDGSISPAFINYLVRTLGPEGMGYLLIDGKRTSFLDHNLPDAIVSEANAFFKF